MSALTDDALHIPKEELKAENFTSLRKCTGSYGSAEMVEFKGTGGEHMDCVRVKVGEVEGPLDLSLVHTLADYVDNSDSVKLFMMHPTYQAADGVYATISAPRGALSTL